MWAISDKDYTLFKSLVSMTQKDLKKAMAKYLKSKYEIVINKKEYLVAIGNVPIALVAHLDTVYSAPVQDLFYDKEHTTFWSPDGLGADDRAGIFAIIKLIRMGLRPSIILTTDEEIGAEGAIALSAKECPIPDLKYLIELDRQGKDDCVFYSCNNTEFQKYIESFGFKTRRGTFSDISILMPRWKVCGVNLSVGYYDEHSYRERLNIKQTYDTITKVAIMLQEDAASIPDFKYYEEPSKYHSFFKSRYACSNCFEETPVTELFPVTTGLKTTEYACIDCITKNQNIHWCWYCGNAFKKTLANGEMPICYKCQEEECTKTLKEISKK